MSADGQKIIQDNGYIKADEKAPAYKSNGAKGKVVVGGSSSVTPVMEKLKEAYAKANKDVTVEVQQSDSTTGVTNESSCDIGRNGNNEEKGVKNIMHVVFLSKSQTCASILAQVKDINLGISVHKW